MEMPYVPRLNGTEAEHTSIGLSLQAFGNRASLYLEDVILTYHGPKSWVVKPSMVNPIERAGMAGQPL